MSLAFNEVEYDSSDTDDEDYVPSGKIENKCFE